MAGLLFGSLALYCLFFIFQRLLDSLGFLSGVSLLFCPVLFGLSYIYLLFICFVKCFYFLSYFLLIFYINFL